MQSTIVFSWVRQLFFIVNNNAFLDERKWPQHGEKLNKLYVKNIHDDYQIEAILIFESEMSNGKLWQIPSSNKRERAAAGKQQSKTACIYVLV